VLVSALRWSVRTLDRALDGETVYRELLAGEPVAFWLDGSLTDRAPRRISVLGTTAGADVVVRDVADGDVFAELNELLAARAAEPPPELTGLFCGGYVGYFGYELKALTGGAAAHEAPTPDALWIWADRFLVIDHDRDLTYLVALDGGEDWLDRAEEAASNWWMGSVDVPAIARMDLEAHLEHNFSGFIMNKIPGLRKLKLQEIIHVNYLTTPNLHNYYELGVGIKYLNLRVLYGESHNSGANVHSAMRVSLSF